MRTHGRPETITAHDPADEPALNPAAPPAGEWPLTQAVTFLDTRDLGRTADFYERVIGLRLARDQGTCRVYHVCGSAYVGFCQRDDAPQPAPHVTLTLVTDHVDEWFARLAAHGVEIVKAPADNPPYRIYNGFARDPNGYLLEIQRFWEPLA